jgi:hypothetical protein
MKNLQKNVKVRKSILKKAIKLTYGSLLCHEEGKLMES